MIENAKILKTENLEAAKFGSRDGEYVSKERVKNLEMSVLYDDTGRRYYLRITFQTVKEEQEEDTTEIMLDVRNCKVTHRRNSFIHVIKDDISAREYIIGSMSEEDYKSIDSFLSVYVLKNRNTETRRSKSIISALPFRLTTEMHSAAELPAGDGHITLFTLPINGSSIRLFMKSHLFTKKEWITPIIRQVSFYRTRNSCHILTG